MLGETPDGRIVKLKKGCECVCHNEPHWVYMDLYWKDRNRDLLREEGRTIEQQYFGALAYQKEEIARLDSLAASFRAAGIVRLVPEACDELTDIQRQRLAPPKKPEISPYVNHATEVRKKARAAW